MPRVENAILERCIGMIEAGVSRRDVARRLNVSRCSVNRAWNRYVENNSPNYTHGGGRQRCTTPAMDRFLRRTVLRNRHLNSTQVKQILYESRGVAVSNGTIINRLKEANFASRRPARHPKWTLEHKRIRLQFARDHQHWNYVNWSNCLFTDESRFCLHPDSNRKRVWRRRNERYDENCTVERIPFGGYSVMVWGGVALGNQKTELVVFINTTMNARNYLDRILEPVVLPYVMAQGPDFVYMDDNARPHRAGIVNHFFEEHGITRMVWPALSPDLNPIEHVWDALQRRISSRPHAANNVNELAIALQEEWDALPGDLINSIVESMPRRCEAVIRAQGGATRY